MHPTIHLYIHPSIHTYVHTHLHIYIQAYMHITRQMSCQQSVKRTDSEIFSLFECLTSMCAMKCPGFIKCPHLQKLTVMPLVTDLYVISALAFQCPHLARSLTVISWQAPVPLFPSSTDHPLLGLVYYRWPVWTVSIQDTYRPSSSVPGRDWLAWAAARAPCSPWSCEPPPVISSTDPCHPALIPSKTPHIAESRPTRRFTSVFIESTFHVIDLEDICEGPWLSSYVWIYFR